MNLHYKFVKPTRCYTVPDDELAVIERFNTIGSDSWTKGLSDNIGFENGDVTIRNRTKKDLKKLLLIEQGNFCYYCGRSFNLFGDTQERRSRNIHIDHILPKNAAHGHYGRFVFEPRNLILACFICNGADFKGIKDFCITPEADYADMDFSIAHPYLDDICEHLKIGDDGRVEKININTKKGDLMEEVFGLNDTYFVESRMLNIRYLREELSKAEESEIEYITSMIPSEGFSAIK
nr:HNH endonuclease [Escherichia coli]